MTDVKMVEEWGYIKDLRNIKGHCDSLIVSVYIYSVFLQMSKCIMVYFLYTGLYIVQVTVLIMRNIAHNFTMSYIYTLHFIDHSEFIKVCIIINKNAKECKLYHSLRPWSRVCRERIIHIGHGLWHVALPWVKVW